MQSWSWPVPKTIATTKWFQRSENKHEKKLIWSHWSLPIHPENMRKPKVFWCFQGVYKETSGKTWAFVSKAFISPLRRQWSFPLRILRIWSHLMKKSLKLNFLCSVYYTQKVKYIYIKISENLVNKKGLNAYMLMAVNITSYWILYLLLKLVQNFISFFPPNSHGSRTIMKDQQCWLDNSAYSSVQNKLMIITTKHNLKNSNLIKRD